MEVQIIKIRILIHKATNQLKHHFLPLRWTKHPFNKQAVLEISKCSRSKISKCLKAVLVKTIRLLLRLIMARVSAASKWDKCNKIKLRKKNNHHLEDFKWVKLRKINQRKKNSHPLEDSRWVNQLIKIITKKVLLSAISRWTKILQSLKTNSSPWTNTASQQIIKTKIKSISWRVIRVFLKAWIYSCRHTMKSLIIKPKKSTQQSCEHLIKIKKLVR